MSAGAFEEFHLDLPELLTGQTGLASGAPRAFEPLCPLGLPLVIPPACGLTADPCAAGDLGLTEPLGKPDSRLKAALLQGLQAQMCGE